MMSKDSPKPSDENRSFGQTKPDELAGSTWEDRGELSEADKRILDATLADYERSPNAGSPWEEVMARIQSRFDS